MGTVVVVGSLHLDVLVHAPDRPRKGETLAGTAWGLQAGGKGGNQAVNAARHGAQTFMVGRVGDDDFGVKLLDALQRGGVSTAYVQLDPTANSGMSVAMIDREGDYGAIIVSGVNQHVGAEDLAGAREIIAAADCLVLQYEIPLASVWAAAGLAREHGVRVILNAAPAYPTAPEDLALVDLLVVNEIEAQMLSGLPVDTPEQVAAAARHLVTLVPTVIVTLGGRGVTVAERGQPLQHRASHRITLVDTHGAGDSFIGALAARLAAGEALMDAVTYANAAAALTCMGRGPQPDGVTPEAVQKLLGV
jgi:ribokinase